MDFTLSDGVYRGQRVRKMEKERERQRQAPPPLCVCVCVYNDDLLYTLHIHTPSLSTPRPYNIALAVKSHYMSL